MDKLVTLTPPLASPWILEEDHKLFNISRLNNFKIIVEYARNHLQDVFKTFESDVTQKYLLFKRKETGLPYTILATRSNIYIHLAVSLVPERFGGTFKNGSRSYSYLRGKDVAKLTTKINIALFDRKEERKYECALNEERILALCTEKNLPNIVRLLDVFWRLVGKFHIQYLYLDYCPHMNLALSLKRLSSQNEKIKKIILDILLGLSALHEHKFVHGDVKPHNILLDRNDEVRIADFGLSSEESDEKGLFYEGALYFMDPEKEKDNSKKRTNDTFSCGVMIFGLLSSPPAISGCSWLNGAETATDIFRLHRERRDVSFPKPEQDDPFKLECWKMLQLNPALRPEMKGSYSLLLEYV